MTTLNGISAALLAQVNPAASGSGGAAPGIQSIWDFCVKGGPVMIPIGLCSLVALTVIIERLISLRRARVIPPSFFVGLQAALRNGRRDIGAALEYCRRNPSPVASVLSAGIKRLGEPIELLERHIQEAGEREVVKLRKHLRMLSLISSIATLLGLLGTIFGMITAFQTVAASGDALGKTELLARGIYEALITTAAGLIVAIPVMIAFHTIAAKIEALVSEMDSMTVEFVEEFVMSRTAADGAAARPDSTSAAERRDADMPVLGSISAAT